MMRTFISFILALGASAGLAFAWLNIWLPRSAGAADSSVNPLNTGDEVWAAIESDPAYSESLASGPVARRRAARAWSSDDPRAVMAHADALPDDEVRARFIDGVAEEWGLADPDGFLAYVRTLDHVDHLRKGLATAMLLRPEQVLGIAANHPSVRIEAERTLEEATVAAITERDAMAALAYLDTLPSGERHLHIRRVVAETWAHRIATRRSRGRRRFSPPHRVWLQR